MIRFFRSALLVLSILVLAEPLFGGSYVVTNTSDIGPGSLRQGILDANSGVCTTPCTITFATPLFTAPQVINVGITTMVVGAPNLTIDGFSGGSTGTPNTNSFGAADNSVHNVILNGASSTCCVIFQVQNLGFTLSGVVIQDVQTAVQLESTGALISGNKFGTDTAGNALVSTLGNAVIMDGSGAAGNTIGGTSPGDRNIIAGSTVGPNPAGILISNGSFSNQIEGNYIGTSASTLTPLANVVGVKTVSGADGNFIGTPGNGNLISGNSIGISMSTQFNSVSDNLIGTSAFGNSSAGIFVNVSTTGTQIKSNSIRNNGGNGIEINDGTGIEIQGNIIEANLQIGIDLYSGTNFVGPDPNDLGDPDSGANGQQNFPAISSARVDTATPSPGGNLYVRLSIDSSLNVPAPGGFKFEFFEADADASFPEGKRPLGITGCYPGPTLTNVDFVLGLPPAGLALSSRVVGAATAYVDSSCTSVIGTSEFSAPAVTVTQQPGIVTNTLDSGPGSLRQAIADVNGGNCFNAPFCQIVFHIPTTDLGYSAGTGVFTIRPLSNLPIITASTTSVSGQSQTFFTGNTNTAGPEIEVNGSLAGAGAFGFQIAATPISPTNQVSLNELVINGWSGTAVSIVGDTVLFASNNSVRNCYIGTNAQGTAAVPNGHGIDLGFNAMANYIGSGFLNIISGNSAYGIYLYANSESNYIYDNRIGTDLGGTLAIPNGHGIYIDQAARANLIGGIVAGPNIIAFNALSGVTVTGAASVENYIRRNLIYQNGGLGIDLAPSGVLGVTPNDLADADTGPNNLQNFPVLTAATFGGTNTTITGTLNSMPSSTFEIDFYTNVPADPSGFGEGRVYIGTQAGVATDASGNASFSFVATGDYSLSHVSATASRQGSITWETSELSAIINLAPVATGDTQSTSEDTPVTTNVVSNDSDPEADTFAITSSTNGTNGTVTCSATSCTYTPNLNFNGTDSYTYTNTDAYGAATIGTVTVTIIAVNDPPVGNPDVVTTNEDAPITFNVLTNDTDVDGPSPLTLTGNTTPTKGTVTCAANGSCTYTPTLNQTGADSFDYSVFDGAATSTGTVNITITGANDPPIANPDALTTNEDTPGTVNVLTNDSDIDGPGSLTVVGSTNGSQGTVVCAATGNCTYTPNANANGADSFTYTVSDGATTTVGTVSVTITPVNDPPIANNDTATTPTGTPVTTAVTANDSDIDGGTLTITGFTQGANGSVTCSGGSCTYTPNPAFTGADSYTYTISDGQGGTAIATVSVTVGGVANTPPIARNDSASTTPSTPVTINVLANDNDPDGDPLTITSFTQGVRGRVTCSSTRCTYSPDAGVSGRSDSFMYTISDGRGGTASARVGIDIAPCPDSVTFLFPTDGARDVPTSGNFAFIAAASNFTLYLGPVGSGCTTLFGSSNRGFFPYSGLTGGTQYEMSVDASAPGCPTTIRSACIRFTTVATCNIAPPTPLSPLAGTVVSSPVTFTWTAVTGAASYTVFASVGGGPDQELGTTTGTSLTRDLADGTLNWYVVANDVPNCGALRSARVTANTCNIPEAPIARVVAEATAGQTITVSWNLIAGANVYEVLEANNEAFNGAQTHRVAGTSIDFTYAFAEATAMFFRVRGVADCNGAPGRSSPTIRAVIVPIPPPDRPDPNANAPAGSDRPVEIQIFVPGVAGQTLSFSATVDKPWMSVRPSSGPLPPDGVILFVTLSTNLPNGTSTGTVIVVVDDGQPSNGRVGTHGSTTTSKPVSISLVTPVAPTSATTPTAGSLIIPAVGHLDSADRWRSDVRIANVSGGSLRYQLTLTPSDPLQGVKQTVIDVGAGETTALDDIVRSWYGIGSMGESSAGVLEVRPLTTGAGPSATTGKTTVVSSRTYNITPTSNGTLGQYIPGIPFTNFVGKAAEGAVQQILSLQQISQNSSYRTNVGVVEASGQPVSLMLSIYEAGGTKLRDIPLELQGHEQRQFNSFLAQQGITLNDGRIEVRLTGGEGKVTAYASVIDNRSRDQLFAPAITLGQISSDRYVMPGIADINTGSALWRSDLRIFNSDSSPQSATLTFYPQNNTGAPSTAAITINSGEVKVIDDVLRSLFSLSNTGGAVHVATPASSSLSITGRTYNQTTNGTLGQFIPAVTPAEAIGSGDAPLHIVQIEDSVRYRTNVGFAEVTGNPATIEVTISLPDSKVAPKVEIPLAANEFRQIPVLQQLGIGNIYNAKLSLQVIGGTGKVTAYGSVIDQKTQDSTYVPAQ